MTTLCKLAAVAGLLVTTSLQATLQVTLIQDTANYSGSDGGGEFRAVGSGSPQSLNQMVNWSAYNTTAGHNTASTAVGNTYFQTFCTEYSEHFSPGTLYNVSSIGNNAMYNNTSGPNGIPITMGVAYLYSQFAAGTLTGYDYTFGSGRTASALNLQRAIWYLLGEAGPGGLTGGALAALNAVTGGSKLFATSADWSKPSNGAFGVYDMVIGAPGEHQDQLIIAVPEASTLIAGALLLLPLGASVIRVLRKNHAAR